MNLTRSDSVEISSEMVELGSYLSGRLSWPPGVVKFRPDQQPVQHVGDQLEIGLPEIGNRDDARVAEGLHHLGEI